MEDFWVKIKSVKGGYFISNLGNVKRFKNNKFKLLKGSVDTGGYSYHIINNKYMSKHRLVAEAFIPNPENKPCVNHIDGVKSNNIISNLEWVTYKENMQHATKMGLNYGSKEGTNSQAKKIINIKTNQVFECGVSACNTTTFKYTTFIAMLAGRFKNKSDFRWL